MTDNTIHHHEEDAAAVRLDVDSETTAAVLTPERLAALLDWSSSHSVVLHLHLHAPVPSGFLHGGELDPATAARVVADLYGPPAADGERREAEERQENAGEVAP